MEGREVFKHAVIKLAEVVEASLSSAGLEASDIDWLVPPQANQRIIDATPRQLHLPPQHVVLPVDRPPNTHAASVQPPLADDVPHAPIPCRDVALMEDVGRGASSG